MLRIVTLIALLIASTVEIAFANAVDVYRQILLNGNYTIRYENVTPARRITNRDRMELFGSSGMAVNRNDYLVNKSIFGLIVGAGADRYEEVGDGAFDMCRLTKGGENFLFTRYTKGNKVEYFGKDKNRVEANARNYLSELINGESYGDEDMSRLLNAMLPDNVKSADMPRYEFVRSGRLDGGITFEDYKSTEGGTMSAIRYYFDGERLIKIASADYRKRADGRIDGHHCIVKIKEFTSTPDRDYLKLPSEVKDVTNRRKEG